MEVRSTLRYAKISAFKVREVTRAIQGLPVSAALDLVAFSPKKAAGMIEKTLKSAVANAENNANLKVDTLVVKEAIAGEGPTMKRMMARARGSGSRILKRSAHIITRPGRLLKCASRRGMSLLRCSDGIGLMRQNRGSISW